MAKSSSRSRKKNRSNAKASSQARTRKKTKTRSKKYESKKLRRRHVSDDDDSNSSMSGSSYSSSSEDLKIRSKRSRSHTKKDKKKDSSRARKRKGSKRKHDYEAKNKNYSKKKRRRNDTPSSSSDRSVSCSSCKDGHEVDLKKHKSSKRAREERNLGKAESPLKRSRYGSRSPSYSQCSESSTYQSKEGVLVENTSRRLRSVITIAERPDEELNKDEHKEEMVFDYDDYPSSRSNDSNDVGSKRLENEKGEETAVSHLRFPKLVNTGKVSDRDDEVGSDPSTKEYGTSHPANEKPTELFDAITSGNNDDLELVLRQKALENLRKFRGGRQTNGKTDSANQKDKNNVDEKAPQSSTTKAESAQIRFTEQDDSRVVGGNSPREACVEQLVSTEPPSVKQQGIPAVGNVTTYSSQIKENIIAKSPGRNEFASTKHNIARSTFQMAIADNLKQKLNAGTSTVKSKLATPALKRQLSKTDSTQKQAPKCEKTQEKLLVDEKTLDETAVITNPTVTKSSNNNDGEGISNASSSAALEPSLKSSPGDTKSDTLQEEAQEGSQFEQKTMSVMRGGEMVQVSYKVYIPKKVPALARRQLKR
ncbi:hypothetical protein G4B88_015102 [Cannabis sativa]|uniref:BZIP domain-containing protein n=1 Tax=Cannabis sativa TaxID=3483 RepID=A0A7J6DKD9_CANSA|nr:hypothetical protein G4B88_015102 [Cannabis sativa]